MKTIAIIPAWNEEKTVGGVVKATLPFVDEVMVIDDCSSDKTFERASEAGAKVFRHSLNRGLGGALGTGFEAALQVGADCLVTLDADGQHDPAEIPKLTSLISRGLAEVVIGSRLLNTVGMPWYRQAMNHFGNFFTFLMFGIYVTDSQSGFRAFSREAIQRIKIRSNQWEVSSEIVAEIRRHGLRLAEVPIKAIYTDYSLSKGQSLKVGLKTAYRLMIHRLGK